MTGLLFHSYPQAPRERAPARLTTACVASGGVLYLVGPSGRATDQTVQPPMLKDVIGSYLIQRRFQTSLLTGFSIVALLMAAVGIYGLIQYSIATRTREIGLRIAIGAQPGAIFRMIINEGLTLSLTGAAIGILGASWLGRAGSSLLFGVTASDPLTFTAVALLLMAVTIAACYFPARRAMRVDPIVALRVT